MATYESILKDAIKNLIMAELKESDSNTFSADCHRRSALRKLLGLMPITENDFAEYNRNDVEEFLVELYERN